MICYRMWADFPVDCFEDFIPEDPNLPSFTFLTHEEMERDPGESEGFDEEDNWYTIVLDVESITEELTRNTIAEHLCVSPEEIAFTND